MTSKERFCAAVEHRPPDRVPIDLRFSARLEQRLRTALGLEGDAFWRWLGQDAVTVRPSFPCPATPIHYADPTVRVEGGYYYDIYQVPFHYIESGSERYLEPAPLPPLAELNTLEELRDFPWPTVAGWSYSGIPAALEAQGQRALWARSRGPFQTAMLMRGTEQFLVDMLTEPEYANFLLERIMDFVLEDARRTLEAGAGCYTFIEYNDDIATQRGLLISPALWRELLKPRMKAFCDMAKGFGVKVKYHSCGSVATLIEDFIEVGVDILNPLQPLAADMDPYRLKADYGDRICLHGGVDIQRLLPQAGPAEVRREIIRMVETLGRDGGWVLAGSHTLQADIPTENVAAIVEAVKEVYGLGEL